MHGFERETGTIFYTQVATNGIGCWNTRYPHTADAFQMLAHNNRTMIYPSDLSVSEKKPISSLRWAVTKN